VIYQVKDVGYDNFDKMDFDWPAGQVEAPTDEEAVRKFNEDFQSVYRKGQLVLIKLEGEAKKTIASIP